MKRWTQVVSTIVLGLTIGGGAVAEQLPAELTASRIDEVKSFRAKSGDVWNYKIDENHQITSMKRGGSEGVEISFAYEGNSLIPAARRFGANPWREIPIASDTKAGRSEAPFATSSNDEAEVRRFERPSNRQLQWSVQPKAKSSPFAMRYVIGDDVDLTDQTLQNLLDNIQLVWNDEIDWVNQWARRDTPEEKARCRQECDNLKDNLDYACYFSAAMNVYVGGACLGLNLYMRNQCRLACGL